MVCHSTIGTRPSSPAGRRCTRWAPTTARSATPGVRTPCSTRWTIRFISFKPIARKRCRSYNLFMPRISSGLLMYRRQPEGLQVLLVHPGGPFWKNKDDGAWSIPKGEAGTDEDLLTRARIEFQEELGIQPQGDWISLRSIKQKGGKTVHAWAFEGDLPPSFELKCNS